MIDGIWWLVIILAIAITLWIVAKSQDTDTTKTIDKNSGTSSSTSKITSNDALQKTLKLVKQYFPDYRARRKGNHLLLTKQGVKVAMITVDKKIAIGERHLGGVLIINYHRAPSRAQLGTNLKDAG